MASRRGPLPGRRARQQRFQSQSAVDGPGDCDAFRSMERSEEPPRPHAPPPQRDAQEKSFTLHHFAVHRGIAGASYLMFDLGGLSSSLGMVRRGAPASFNPPR